MSIAQIGDMPGNEEKDKFVDRLKALPQAFQDWITEIGWKLEQIVSILIENQALPNGVDDKDNLQFIQGKSVTITVERSIVNGGQSAEMQYFNRLSNGEWERV